MKRATQTLLRAAALGLALTTANLLAADHGDAPALAQDLGSDINDVYGFLDPGDPTKVVLIATVHGFLVPGEARNFGIFDEDVRYSFHIENTGDSAPDMFIDVTFNQTQRPPLPEGDPAPLPGFKDTPRTEQDAFIKFRGKVPADLAGAKGNTHAAVQVANFNEIPDPLVPKLDLKNAKGDSVGIDFFAGEVDDPFFFDIPAFSRFVTRALAHDINAASEFSRARDTFAGYNTLAIAIRIPVAKLLPSKGNAPATIGIAFSTSRKTQHPVRGDQVGVGGFSQLDRMGVPGINVVFIPYNSKNSYNGATTIDDGKGKFFTLIKGTLDALGTTGTNLTTLVSVTGLPGTFPIPRGGTPGTGDYLRLSTLAATPPGFPNGRRPQDDVIDTVLSLVTNGVLTTGDNVNNGGGTLSSNFPFLAVPNQPRYDGAVDDKTRN